MTSLHKPLPNQRDVIDLLIGFSRELAAIDDTHRFRTLVAEFALSLVNADEAQVYLDTRPLTLSDNPFQFTVPLQQGNRVLGVMVVSRHYNTQPDDAQDSPAAFGSEEKQLLTLVASVSAVAAGGLKRAQGLRRRSEWRSRALELLQETGQAMGSTLEMDPLLRRMINAIVHALGADSGVLALLDDRGFLTVRAIAGARPPDAIGTVVDRENSLLGWVILNKQSKLVTDSATDRRLAADHQLIHRGGMPGALLASPLATKGQIIGAVELTKQQPDAFDLGDLHLLEAAAETAAAAIENARVCERLQRQVLQQENTISVTHALSSARDFGSILQLLVESALTVIPSAHTAAVHLLAPGQNVLLLGNYAGHPLWDRFEQPLAVSEGIAGHVFSSRALLNVPDVRSEPRFLSGQGPVGYRSLLVAPLFVEDEPVGTLSVNGIEPHAFGADDENMLLALAGQTSVALHHTRLHERTQERAAGLESAYHQLQDLTRRKSQFVQNTSHELRSPLTLLQGYLEMLQTGAFGSLSSEQLYVVEFLSHQSRQLVDLVNDIATLAEIELFEEDVEPVDLAGVVMGSVYIQQERSSNADSLVEQDPPDQATYVMGNQHRLMQVFFHLLDNAIKFSPRGSKVRVRIWRDGDYALVDVSDNGIGISPDSQKFIFDRFYQVDGSTTRRYGGTGLGLSIVKETVEAHGGAIRVESSGVAGEGSTFRVKLPLLAEADASNQLRGSRNECGE